MFNQTTDEVMERLIREYFRQAPQKEVKERTK